MRNNIFVGNRNATLPLIATVLVVLNFLFWCFRFRSELDVFMVGAILGACTFGVIYVALLEVLPRLVTEREGEQMN